MFLMIAGLVACLFQGAVYYSGWVGETARRKGGRAERVLYLGEEWMTHWQTGCSDSELATRQPESLMPGISVDQDGRDERLANLTILSRRHRWA